MKELPYCLYKGNKIAFEKSQERHLLKLKKAIDILKIISPNLFQKLQKVKLIVIVKTKIFGSAVSYTEIGTVVVSDKILKNQSLFWVAGILVHETAHILEPKKLKHKLYKSELNATIAEQKFYTEGGDFLYFNFISPSGGRKKYFKDLKQRELKYKKDNHKIYRQLHESPEDTKKMNDIAYGIASKKILLTKKSNK